MNKAVVNEDTTGTILLLQQKIKRLNAEIVELKAKLLTMSKNPKTYKLEVEKILQSTIEIRQSDEKYNNTIIEEKNKEILLLKKCLKRYQHDRDRDQVLIKDKDEAIAKLKEGKFSENDLVDLLQKEITLIRESEGKELGNLLKFYEDDKEKEELIRKNNEQKEYIDQLNAYIKNMIPEDENQNLKSTGEIINIEKCKGLSEKYLR